MKTDREKPFSYYDLVTAFHDAVECAFCELEAAYMNRYADNFFYENVNNLELRAKLAESGGFCHRHSELLLSMNDSLGTAIIYKAQLEFLSDAMKKNHNAPVGKLHSEIGKNISSNKCPACISESDDRLNRINTFWDWIGDEKLKTEFEAGPCICKEHLKILLAHGKDEKNIKYLVDVQSGKYKLLIAELEEFIRKNDYRFAKEGFGKEKDSWIRAVRVMNGGKYNF